MNRFYLHTSTQEISEFLNFSHTTAKKVADVALPRPRAVTAAHSGQGSHDLHLNYKRKMVDDLVPIITWLRTSRQDGRFASSSDVSETK